MSQSLQPENLAPLPVSVVVVVKNMQETLEECLKSIRKNSPAEIIVIDGNSKDRTVSIARENADKVYSDEGKGPSYAHQLGAETASQEFIAFVDGDVVLPENSLRIMLEEIKTTRCGNIQARMIAASRGTYWERVQDWQQTLHESRMPGGLTAALLRRDLVLSVGFDCSNIHGEDFDFLSRLKKKGYEVSNSKAFVYHHYRSNILEVIRAYRRVGDSSRMLIRKWGVWHTEFWPQLSFLYWLSVCIVKGKPWYIPYVLVSSAARAYGMLVFNQQPYNDRG